MFVAGDSTSDEFDAHADNAALETMRTNREALSTVFAPLRVGDTPRAMFPRRKACGYKQNIHLENIRGYAGCVRPGFRDRLLRHPAAEGIADRVAAIAVPPSFSDGPWSFYLSMTMMFASHLFPAYTDRRSRSRGKQNPAPSVCWKTKTM